MPVTPAVPPPAAVPTPPASLAHQLDRRGGAELGPGRLGSGDGSSLGRDGRESYQAGECGKDRAHLSLQRGTAMAKADAHMARVLPVMETIRDRGATSLRGIAEELTRQGILTARGGRWYATTVKNLLDRAAR